MVRRWCASLIVAAALLPACGGRTATSVPGAGNPSGSLASHCTDVVADDLGEGTLCVDTGFRTDTDQFTFANSGRSPVADLNVTVQTLIDLFGHSTVCMPGPETQCVLRPRTRQKLDEWNVALGGGRCEGMATLSQRLFMRYETPDEYEGGAATTAELKQGNTRLAQAIVYWWATQFVPEVARPAAESRTRTPLQLVDELIRGLANGVGHTVGMYYGGAGHSVTPFAVTRRGGDYVIHVYDNNQPGVRAEIVVNGADNTWTFANGRSGEESTAVWSGTTGTLELTPMVSRQGPFTCPFCDDPTPNSATTLTVTNQADAPANYLFVDAGDAGTIEQTASGLNVGIAGATVENAKAGTTSSLTVTLPAGLRDTRVELRHVREQVTESVVTVRRPAMADLQVRNARSTGTVGAARITHPLLELTADGTTVHANGGDTLVSLAGATNLTTVTVAADDTLVVSRIASDSVEVSYRGTTGTAATRVTLNPGNSTVTQLVPGKGTLGATSREVSAQPVGAARTTRAEPLPRTTPTSTVHTTVPSIDVTLPG